MLLNLFFSLSLLYGSFASSPQFNSSAANNASNFSSLVIEDPLLMELFKYSGFVQIEPPHDSRFFFFFFPKRDAENPEESPLILWLMGMPGLSSSVALFHENGPFYLRDDFKLARREDGWDKEANILYVDEPLGTGLISIHQTQSIPRSRDEQVVHDLHKFIQEFFKIRRYKKFRQCPLFVIGQMYAGKYAPKLAARIIRENALAGVSILNLKGVAIGNGMTNPTKQFSTLLYNAAEMGYIHHTNISVVTTQLQVDCMTEVKECEKYQDGDTCEAAFRRCDALSGFIKVSAGNKNVLDFTKGTLKYDFSNVETFLNLESTKEAYQLLQGESSGSYRTFSYYHHDIHIAMIKDYMKNSEGDVVKVLDKKFSVLIYAGKNNVAYNWKGNEKWVSELKWNKTHTFRATKPVAFIVNGDNVGTKRAAGPLTFVVIRKAGAYVPLDRPQVALNMIKTWMEAA